MCPIWGNGRRILAYKSAFRNSCRHLTILKRKESPLWGGFIPLEHSGMHKTHIKRSTSRYSSPDALRDSGMRVFLVKLTTKHDRLRRAKIVLEVGDLRLLAP